MSRSDTEMDAELDAELRSLRPKPLAPQAAERMRAAIQQPMPRRTSGPWLMVAAAAAIALTIGLTFLGAPHASAPAQPSRDPEIAREVEQIMAERDRQVDVALAARVIRTLPAAPRWLPDGPKPGG